MIDGQYIVVQQGPRNVCAYSCTGQGTITGLSRGLGYGEDTRFVGGAEYLCNYILGKAKSRVPTGASAAAVAAVPEHGSWQGGQSHRLYYYVH